MISYQTDGVEMPSIKKRETTEWIKSVAATYGKRVGEIAYIFCSDEKILEVNRQYLQHDYYTDIITFDYCEGNRLSGDLFISLDTVRTNAEQFADNNYERELYRVIIHIQNTQRTNDQLFCPYSGNQTDTQLPVKAHRLYHRLYSPS